MGGKIGEVWNKVRYFCITQTNNFYAGMAFAVIWLLSLTKMVPLAISMAVCPFITALSYMAVRNITETWAQWKKNREIWKNLAAVMIGSLWVLLLTVI
jgi:hypothetical protein